MKRNITLAPLLLAGATCAQTSYFVVPGKYATTRGQAYNYYSFYTNDVPSHAQWIYNDSDIRLSTARIQGIAFRRTCATGNACPSYRRP